jgi:hypothetical protein
MCINNLPITALVVKTLLFRQRDSLRTIIYHFNFEQNKHEELYEKLIHNRGYGYKSHAVIILLDDGLGG